MNHTIIGRSWLLLGLGLLLQGCVTESTGPARAADPQKQIATLVELGTGYLRNGEYGRAKEHLLTALELDPRSPTAHNTLALVFQLEQEYDVAEEHFKIAIRNKPDFTRARNNYAAFLFDRGRFSDAIEQLQLAAEDRFYAGRPTVFENLGVAYLRTDDPVAAEQAFQRSIALNPEQARALVELANIRFEQRRYVESRELYYRYEAISSQTARGLWLCVRLARVFDDSNREASCALALRNIFPTSAEYKQFEEMARER
ncbi:MAG: type IV pilus biogenesis/stability protein PilW [Pseudomonadota bacterium]